MIQSSMQYAPTDPGEAGAPQTESDDHSDVLDEFNRRFKHSKSHWDDWRKEARQLYDLVAGRQWDEADEAKLKDELRPMVTFNVSGKYMDVITGLQINNRQETRFYPRKPGTASVDPLLNGAVTWARDVCDQVDDETDAFFDATLTGLGWMEGYLDKDLDPGGVPAGQRVDNLEMFPDPAARKRNLSDATYNIRIRYVSEDEYYELCGEEMPSGSDSELADLDTDDDGIQLIEEPQDYQKNQTAGQGTKRNKCPVADYQFWKREDRYLLKHPQLGSKELSKEEFDAYQPFFKKAAANGQVFQTQKIRRKVYYRAFIAYGRVCKYGLSPYQKGFTYHAITGKRDRNTNTWFGIGRSILDPQKWLNKFFSTILYVMMTNAKGGIMAEENTFKDSRKAESEWANPNSITWLKDGALQKGKIEPKPPAVYPQGLDRLMEFTLNSLPQTTGLNVELMGLADRDQAGVVEAQRKQSAMAIIAWAFDSMRRYYRSMGRQQAQYVIDYVPEGTLVMIAGDEGKQYVPILKGNLPLDFEITVDEAPTSVNMQERTWLVLQELIPNLLQAGITVPPDVLDYAPLPQDLIQKWKQALKPDPQKQQYDVKTALATLQKLLAEGHEKEASAKLKEAQAGEAGAKSQEHVASALEKAALAGQAQAHPF